MNVKKSAVLGINANRQSANDNKISSVKNIDQRFANASSLEALAAQGRAFVNTPKISFRGTQKYDLSDKNKLAKKLEAETDLTPSIIEDIMNMSDEKIEEALALYDEGIIPDIRLCDAVNTDDKSKERMLKLIRSGITADALIPFKDYNEEDKQELEQMYSNIEEILEEDKNYKNIVNFIIKCEAMPEKNNLARASYIYDLYSSPQIALKNMFFLMSLDEILNMDDKKYQKFTDLVDMGITDLEGAAEISNSDDDTYKRAIDFINEGLGDDAIYLAKIDDEKQVKKVRGLSDKYKIPIYSAVEISKFDEKKYKNAIKLLDIGVFDNNLLEISDETLDKLISLEKEGCDFNELISQLNERSIFSFKTNEEKVSEFIENSKKNNERWNDFISQSAKGEEYKKQLTKEDLVFLKTHAFDSKFYSPEEYIDSFLYFKNLKTPSGENILRCDSFINKIKEGGLGDFAADADNILYKNIEQLLLINPSSTEASYIQSIIELIKEGKANPSAFRKLSDLNDIKSIEGLLFGFDFSSRTNSSNWAISNNLKKDVDLMHDTIVDNANSNSLNNDFIDKYIPTYKTEEEGIKNSKIGDAFLTEGGKYIKLKTDEDKAQTVKLTKETYARLFPPIERFLTSQQIMGNCYCIETLMSMYCNDKTRINLLKTMEEDEKGNVTIKMGDYKPVTLKDGKLPENEPKEIYSSGADGFKLFEYAYSCALVQDKIKEAESELEGDKLLEFKNFIKSNPNNFFIYKDKGKVKWTTYDDAVKNKLYKKNSLNPFDTQPYKTFNNFLLGNGGLQYDIYKKFGYNSKIYMGGFIDNFNRSSRKEKIELLKEAGMQVDSIGKIEKAKQLFKDEDFFKHNQVQVGLGAHAYCLTQETDNKGNTAYYLYNPHNQGFPIKFKNLDDLFEKANQITITQMN